jgi:hypothetical protein
MTHLSFFTILALALMSVSANARPSKIEDVDFSNFSYPFKPPTGRDSFGKLGRVVRVRRGIAYADKVGQNASYLYFKVTGVLYGDLTGDGRDDAAVVVIYGSNSGDFFVTDTYVYTMRRGRPALLGVLRQDQIAEDYERYTHDNRSYLFEAVAGGREIRGRKLKVTHFAGGGGGHCCPALILTLRYKFRGNRFILADWSSRKVTEKDDKITRPY